MVKRDSQGVKYFQLKRGWLRRTSGLFFEMPGNVKDRMSSLNTEKYYPAILSHMELVIQIKSLSLCK